MMMRFSTLKNMALSPLHVRHAMTEGFVPSRPMRVGTAVHALAIGTDNVAVYEGTRRGAAWADFCAANEGKDILTASEMDDALRVAESIKRTPLAHSLLTAPGPSEERINWTFRGVPFRSTPDKFVTDGGVLVELKTTRTSEPGAFLRDAYRRAYHAQVATYREALRSQGHDVKRVVIIAAETAAPYPVTVIDVPEATLDVGLRLTVGWLERYIVHAQADVWPGYSDAPVTWDLPSDDLELEFPDDADEPEAEAAQ